MKKYILFVCFLATACLGIAQGGMGQLGGPQNSQIVIFAETNEPFTLVINNQQMNQRPATNVKVTELVPGFYTFRVMPLSPSIPPMELQMQVEGNREITYAMIAGRRGGRRLVFVNEFSLRFNPVPPPQQLLIPYRGAVVIQGGPQVNPGQPINPGLPPQPVMVDPVPPSPLPGYTGPVGCNGPCMSAPDFRQARSSIASKTFSSSKMTLAKQIIRSNCLLSDQVADLIGLFDYESDRLEFAKFAYDFTYDQANYFKVNDAFEYESSIENLERFLQGR